MIFRLSVRRRAVVIALAVFMLISMIELSMPGGAVAGPSEFAGMPVDPPPTLVVKSAIIAEADTGQVLYQVNADERMAPASITKIMTILLAMERVEQGRVSLDDIVIVSREASLMGGSQVYLKEKEQVTVGDLLAATAIRSANDASYALAEFIAGTADDFTRLMNKRAAELGMTGTHFANPEGLDDPNHYTTARDILIMSRELVRFPKVLEWTSTWIGKMRGGTYDLFNTNRLIKDYPGADGLKTGHTDQAGYCLAGTATRNGIRLLSVVMGTAGDRERTQETIKLLDYGFRSFERVELVKEGAEVGTMKVPTAAIINVPVTASAPLAPIVPRGAGNQVSIELKPSETPVKAPIKAGERLGSVVAAGPNGEELARADAIAASDVRRANPLVRIYRAIVSFISNLFAGGRGK